MLQVFYDTFFMSFMSCLKNPSRQTYSEVPVFFSEIFPGILPVVSLETHSGVPLWFCTKESSPWVPVPGWTTGRISERIHVKFLEELLLEIVEKILMYKSLNKIMKDLQKEHFNHILRRTFKKSSRRKPRRSSWKNTLKKNGRGMHWWTLEVINNFTPEGIPRVTPKRNSQINS